METLKQLLKNGAPMLATALGGPFAGGAVKFIAGQLIGDEDAPIDKVVEAVKAATPEQIKDLGEQYRAETERLVTEQGEISETLVSKINGSVAGKIAWLRMATRPWTVRWMVIVMVAPVLILFSVDVLFSVFNSIFAAFGVSRDLGDGTAQLIQFKLIAGTFMSEGSVYLSMYSVIVDAAKWIVLGYMTLRQVDKTGNPFQGFGGALAKVLPWGRG